MHDEVASGRTSACLQPPPIALQIFQEAETNQFRLGERRTLSFLRYRAALVQHAVRQQNVAKWYLVFLPARPARQMDRNGV